MNLLKLFQIFDGGCLESNLVMEIGFKKLLLYLVSFSNEDSDETQSTYYLHIFTSNENVLCR